MDIKGNGGKGVGVERKSKYTISNILNMHGTIYARIYAQKSCCYARTEGGIRNCMKSPVK